MQCAFFEEWCRMSKNYVVCRIVLLHVDYGEFVGSRSLINIILDNFTLNLRIGMMNRKIFWDSRSSDIIRIRLTGKKIRYKSNKRYNHITALKIYDFIFPQYIISDNFLKYWFIIRTRLTGKKIRYKTNKRYKHITTLKIYDFIFPQYTISDNFLNYWFMHLIRQQYIYIYK